MTPAHPTRSDRTRPGSTAVGARWWTRMRRLLVLLASASLVLAMAGTAQATPRPAAADDPAPDHPTLRAGTIQIQNQPAWPAYFVRDAGTDYQVRYTEMGTVAGIYGYGETADTSLYAATAPYVHQPTIPQDTRFTAVGDLDGDESVEVTLAGGAGGRTITVLGSQRNSFPVIAQHTLDDSRGTVTGLVALGSPDSREYLVVTTSAGFLTLSLDGTQLSQVRWDGVGAASFYLSAGNYLDPARILDVYHLPSWRSQGLDPVSETHDAAEGADAINNSFAILFWHGGQIKTGFVKSRYAAGFDIGTQRLVNPILVVPASAILAGRITYTYTKWSVGDDFRAKRQVATALYLADDPGSGRVAVAPSALQPFVPLGRWCSTSLDTTDPANVPDLVAVARPGQDSSAFACAGISSTTVPRLTVFDDDEVLTSDLQTPVPGYQQLRTPRIALENTPRYLDDARATLFPLPPGATPGTPEYQEWWSKFPADQDLDKVSVSMMLHGTPTSGGAPTSVLASRTYCLAASCTMASDPTGQIMPNGRPRFAFPLSAWATPAAAKGSATDPPVFAPLPRTANTVTIEVDDPTTPERVAGDPVPIAVLSAPPTVAGAGQGGSEPTLTRNKGESTATGTSESSHVGASVGVEWESPAGLFGVEVTASIERQVESSSSTSKTITFSDSYSGSMHDDTLVFQTTPQFVFPGTVLSSDSGIGVGTRSAISIPDTDAVTIASATVSSLRARFPDLFGPGGEYTDGLHDILGHTVGDPGSYLSYSVPTLNDYCIGSVDDSTASDISFGPALNINPFQDNPAAPTKPDILISADHLVQAGTGNVEGAGFDIEKGQERSRVANTTVDVSVSAKVAYVKAGVNGGYGWGESYTHSLTQGVGFSAGVGNIPNGDLTDETYDWRMFLCNKNLVTSRGLAIPVRVLGYTVDHYQGSGGLDPLGPITAISPTRSEFTDSTPTLTWRQDSGTVQSYDWQVEAVGAQDNRSGAITFDNTVDATDNRTAETSTSIDTPLLPNQLYRWRVTATDFFGNTVASSWEYFVTEGPPRADFTFNPSGPVAGDGVTFTDTSQDGGLATTRSWTFPDGTMLTGSSVTRQFPDSGAYPVTLRVTNSAGSDQITKIVPVIGGPRDDHYAATEDTALHADADKGVLANDDAPGQLTAAVDQEPINGTLTLNADGSFDYLPNANFCGTDGFSYAMTDGTGATHQGTVAIDVACVDDPPVAADTTLDVTEDAVQQVAAPGLLSSVTDPDTAPGDLTASLVGGAEHGDVVLRADGSVTYTPDPNYCGADAFTYRASDGRSQSDVATVTVNVACVNDAPVAADDRYAVAPGETLTVGAGDGVLANDTDVEDGTPGTATLDTDAAHGTLALNADGSFSYAPDKGYTGDDTFSYFPSDSDHLASPAPATVTIAVRPSPPGSQWCPPDPFPDVPTANLFCTDVAWLKAGQVTLGFTDQDYHPTAAVSRQVMAAFLYRIGHQGGMAPPCQEQPFPDVAISDRFCGAIAWMKGSGITQGYTDNGFHPTDPVSRQAMAVFLYRASHHPPTTPVCTGEPFPDVPTSNLFCGAIGWMATARIAHGYTEGTFDPTRAVSRQVMAAFLHRQYR